MIKEKNIIDITNKFELDKKLALNTNIIQNVSLRMFITLSEIYKSISELYLDLNFDFLLTNPKIDYKIDSKNQQIYITENAKKFFTPQFENNLLSKKIFKLLDVTISNFIDLLSIFNIQNSVYSITLPNYYSTKNFLCPILYKCLLTNISARYLSNILVVDIQNLLSNYALSLNNYIDENKSKIYEYFFDFVSEYRENKSAYTKIYDIFINSDLINFKLDQDLFTNAAIVEITNYILSNSNIYNVDITNLKFLIEDVFNIIGSFDEFIDNKSDAIVEIDISRKFIYDVEHQFEFLANSLYELLGPFFQKIKYQDIILHSNLDINALSQLIDTYNEISYSFNYNYLSKLLLKSAFIKNMLQVFDDFVNDALYKLDKVSVKSMFVIISKTVDKIINDFVDNVSVFDFMLEGNISFDKSELTSYKKVFVDVINKTISYLPVYFIRNFIFG